MMPRLGAMYVAMILALFVSSGCDREPKPLVVTYQLTHTVDTTFNNQYRKAIDREVDSICKVDRRILYDLAVDSLLRIEIAKMEELLD